MNIKRKILNHHEIVCTILNWKMEIYIYIYIYDVQKTFIDKKLLLQNQSMLKEYTFK